MHVVLSHFLQEQEADNLRYAGLPSGDHSVEVDGLGKFAPSGSYAHGGVLGGLGDEEEEVGPRVGERNPLFSSIFPSNWFYVSSWLFLGIIFLGVCAFADLKDVGEGCILFT